MKHISLAVTAVGIRQFVVVRALTSVLLLACTMTAFAQGPLNIATAKDAEDFTQTYYQVPRPEMIGTLIYVLHATALFNRTNAIPPYIGFFSEVFAANPDRVPEWRTLIAKQAHPTKGVLERALSVSKDGGVNAIDGRSAALNDMYWGAFFASGNAKYLNKLIEQLRFIDERNNLELFLLGGVSKWSLASNAQSHAKVRAVLDAAQMTADRRTREILADVLDTDPVRIRQEVNDISRRWAVGGAR